MASLGAQVMQARSIEVAEKIRCPYSMCVLIFSTATGTMIIKEVKRMEEVVVSGITLKKAKQKSPFAMSLITRGRG